MTARLDGRARVAFGRCLPYGSGITYWPLVELVRDLGGMDALATHLDDTEDGRSAIASVRTAISRSDRIASNDEVFWGVRRILEGLAADTPLLICLEDLHWAEPTMLDLVDYLAAFCPRPDRHPLQRATGAARGTTGLGTTSTGGARPSVPGRDGRARGQPRCGRRCRPRPDRRRGGGESALRRAAHRNGRRSGDRVERRLRAPRLDPRADLGPARRTRCRRAAAPRTGGGDREGVLAGAPSPTCRRKRTGRSSADVSSRSRARASSIRCRRTPRTSTRSGSGTP